MTDHEEYIEAEQLEKWFQKFIEVHGKALSPNKKKIETIWHSLSIKFRLKVVDEVTHRLRLCRKQKIAYGDAIRGVFTEAAQDEALRLQPDKRTLVEGEPE